jgi:hypothetical protein
VSTVIYFHGIIEGKAPPFQWRSCALASLKTFSFKSGKNQTSPFYSRRAAL